MFREYHKWFSHRLNRDMELLVFGHSGPRIVVFPTRQGRFFDYENFGMVGSLRDRIEGGAMQLFCVDSADSETLYNKHTHPHHRIGRHKEYESYILEEVLPFTSLKNNSPRLIAHGCSIGAYHSINIAFRHPHIFREVVALSGRYDLTQQIGPFDDLFDGYYNDDIYFHTPNHFIPNMSDEVLLDQLRSMKILLAVGREDPFFDSNVALSRALHEKRIEHEFYVWDGGAHRASAWRRMVRFYLEPQ